MRFAAKICTVVEKIFGIDGFHDYATSKRLRARIRRSHARINAHRLHQTGIEGIGADVVKYTVVLWDTVKLDREVQHIDAVDENLLRDRDTAPNRSGGDTRKQIFDVAHAGAVNLGSRGGPQDAGTQTAEAPAVEAAPGTADPAIAEEPVIVLPEAVATTSLEKEQGPLASNP